MAKTEFITSRTNPRVQTAVKLRDRKYRERLGMFVLDGKKLYEEAVRCGVTLCDIFVTEDYLRKNGELSACDRVVTVSDEVFSKLSAENAPEGIICTAKNIDFLHKFVTIYNIDKNDTTFFAACEVRDPGNVGTIIRTANALGIDRLLLSGCADIYNPRTVRAAMGGLFRQRITVCSDLMGTVSVLQRAGYEVCAAALNRNAVRLDSLCEGTNRCFIVGNEGHGLPKEVIAACDRTVFIPIRPETESLNASAAAAILMWHGRHI